MLIFQQIQNIGMTLGLLPITGITLPFVSYGGSSLLSYMLLVRILLNISVKKKFGQNFLLDQNILNKIVTTLSKEDMKNVIEIGPGLGFLTKEITKITIDPEIVDPEDTEMLEDLITVAVNDAIRQIEAQAEESRANKKNGGKDKKKKKSTQKMPKNKVVV